MLPPRNSTTQADKMSSDAPVNSTLSKGYDFTEALLSKTHPPELVTQIISDKIKGRALNLNPTQASDVQDARTKRRRERERNLASRRKSQRPKPLTAREKRKLQIYEVPRECQQYEIYVPLHNLWIGYIQEVLFGEGGGISRTLSGGNTRAEKGKAAMAGQELAAKVMGADLHGAEIKVVRSRCPSRVGLSGIVIKETKMTFEVVTKDNVLKSEFSDQK